MLWKKKIEITLIISFGQYLNKIWILKVYVFVIFKMKYLINRMQCYTLSQVWWLDGRSIYLHPRGQSFKSHKWCVCSQ
jgi:hypothetical protein